MSAISVSVDYSLPRLTRRIDPRTLRIVVLLAAVCVLNLVDLVCTVSAARMGKDLFVEMNPIADVFIRMGMTPSLVCFKILMTLCGMGLLWKLRRNRLVIPACWILLLAYIGLSILWYVWMSTANTEMELRIASGLPLDP